MTTNLERVRVWNEAKSVLPPHYQQEIADMLGAAEERGREESSVLTGKLKAALADLLGGELNYACEFVHHAKRDKHEWGDLCPVVTRYRTLLDDDTKEPAND